MIVADMNDQVRLLGRDCRGHDQKWPFRGIVAVLQVRTLQPATGIADNGDPLRCNDGCGDRHTIDRDRLRGLWHSHAANKHGKTWARHGPRPHGLCRAVDPRRRARASVGDRAGFEAFTPILRPAECFTACRTTAKHEEGCGQRRDRGRDFHLHASHCRSTTHQKLPTPSAPPDRQRSIPQSWSGRSVVKRPLVL